MRRGWCGGLGGAGEERGQARCTLVRGETYRQDEGVR
jgi:hypothetical protein